MKIFGFNSLGVFKGGILYTKMTISRNFNTIYIVIAV
jgi:hypothetical protein